MKKLARQLLLPTIFFMFITETSVARDRRKDFTFGHYYENFSYNFDTAEKAKGQTNYNIESITVRRQRDNLIVMLFFSDKPVAHADDRIIIMIDNRKLGNSPSTFKSRGKKNAASYVTTKNSIEYYAWETMSEGVISGNITSTGKWIKDPHTGLYKSTLPFIVYNIPTCSLRDNYDNQLSTDPLSLVIIFSSTDESGNISVQDAIPYSACKITTTETTNDTLEIDFSKGHEISGLKIIR